MNKIYKENDYMVMIIEKNNQEYKVLFDEEDYDIVKEYSWHLHHTGYATTWIGNNKHETMHILLMGKQKNGLLIDHINRNRLDNRKVNLRIVNRSINATNAKTRSDKTQLDLPRGVIFKDDDPTPRKDGKGQKAYAHFTVQWSIDGKRKTKSFSVRKFGSYEAAREAAILFREEKMKEMKI